jgi:hypothetical protein
VQGVHCKGAVLGVQQNSMSPARDGGVPAASTEVRRALQHDAVLLVMVSMATTVLRSGQHAL